MGDITCNIPRDGYIFKSDGDIFTLQQFIWMNLYWHPYHDAPLFVPREGTAVGSCFRPEPRPWAFRPVPWALPSVQGAEATDSSAYPIQSSKNFCPSTWTLPPYYDYDSLVNLLLRYLRALLMCVWSPRHRALCHLLQYYQDDKFQWTTDICTQLRSYGLSQSVNEYYLNKTFLLEILDFEIQQNTGPLVSCKVVSAVWT